MIEFAIAYTAAYASVSPKSLGFSVQSHKYLEKAIEFLKELNIDYSTYDISLKELYEKLSLSTEHLYNEFEKEYVDNFVLKILQLPDNDAIMMKMAFPLIPTIKQFNNRSRSFKKWQLILWK